MLHIAFLGHPQVRYEQQPVRLGLLPKTLPLWSCLLLHRAAIPRTSLAFSLWPDASEPQALANLRRHLHDLRRALPTGVEWLHSDTQTIQWNLTSPYWFDVEAFEEMTSQTDRLKDAVSLYTGDLLPNLYEDWIIVHRERLASLHFSTLESLLSRCKTAGDFAGASGYAQQILARDSMREDIARELMILRHQLGDRASALNLYHQLATRLREELGVEPMPETSALYRSISQHGARLAVRREAVPATGKASSPRSLTNLPARLTTLIGREQELARIIDLITAEQPTARLLTLTGPGGTGKSRLSLEVAARLVEADPARFSDGIYFIPLASIVEPGNVPLAIVEALALGGSPSETPLQRLTEYTRNRRMLLILDNFEQILDAAGIVSDLLSASRELRVIVTSRARLHLYGELALHIPPLPLPDLSRLPSVNDLLRYGAIALFVERSRAADPSFDLSSRNAFDVARICNLLDGLPLALELAAARSRTFSPAEMLARLSSRLSFLTGRTRNIASRQQTIRGTIDWSYNLLEEPEQKTFARLALFAGSFTLAAVEEILGEPDGARSAAEQVDTLVDNSMVQVVCDPERGETRFRMLLTLRDYALERLAASAEHGLLQRRHAMHFLALAEEGGPELEGAQQGNWLRRLESEHENLRAALGWMVDRGEQTLALRLAAALGSFWRIRGHLNVGQDWLARVLAIQPSVQDPLLRSRALRAAGVLAYYQADYSNARCLFEESITLAKMSGDGAGESRSLSGYGKAHLYSGDPARAVSLLEESRALACAVGDKWAEAIALNGLGSAANTSGDLTAARDLIHQGLQISEQIHDRLGIAFALWSLGDVYYWSGQMAPAVDAYRKCLPIARELMDMPCVGLVQANLACLALASEAYDEVEELATETLALFERLGERWQPPRLLRMLAHVALRRADIDEARALCTRSMDMNRALGDHRGLTACLITRAAIEQACNNFSESARLLAQAEAMLGNLDCSLLPGDAAIYQRVMARASVGKALPEVMVVPVGPEKDTHPAL